MVTDTSVFDRQASSQNASIFLVLTEKGTTTAVCVPACVSTSVTLFAMGSLGNVCHCLAELLSKPSVQCSANCQALKKWKGANYRPNAPIENCRQLYMQGGVGQNGVTGAKTT